METVRLNVNVPRSLHRRVKSIAAAHGHNLSEIVRQALDEYIAEMERYDQHDARRAREIHEAIDRGEMDTVPWETVRAELKAKGLLDD